MHNVSVAQKLKGITGVPSLPQVLQGHGSQSLRMALASTDTEMLSEMLQ